MVPNYHKNSAFFLNLLQLQRPCGTFLLPFSSSRYDLPDVYSEKYPLNVSYKKDILPSPGKGWFIPIVLRHSLVQGNREISLEPNLKKQAYNRYLKKTSFKKFLTKKFLLGSGIFFI